MKRTVVVTGAGSGIGAATVRHLKNSDCRVITCDLRNAEVNADLTTAAGRLALVDGVERLSGGKIDAIVANAGGGPAETSLQLNFFGAVATLDGLRPLLAKSDRPRAVAVSSVASLRPADRAIVEACLRLDEPGALEAARRMVSSIARQRSEPNDLSSATQIPLALYGNAKYALQRWCREHATKMPWAGTGILLNVVALGFYDTPAAAYVLSNPAGRTAMSQMIPLRGAFPGRAEEAAALLAWCISAENSQMTGQILFADGGMECQLRERALS